MTNVDGPISSAYLERVIALTKAMFSDDLKVDVDVDPALPGEPYIALTVRCTGSPRELAEKRLNWRSQISELPDCDGSDIRLSIVPVSTETGVQEMKVGVAAVVPELETRLSDVVDLTRAIFPGAVSVEVDRDPSNPDDPYVVVNASCAGAPAEILKKEAEWHDKIEQLLPRVGGHLKLSIDPV